MPTSHAIFTMPPSSSSGPASCPTLSACTPQSQSSSHCLSRARTGAPHTPWAVPVSAGAVATWGCRPMRTAAVSGAQRQRASAGSAVARSRPTSCGTSVPWLEFKAHPPAGAPGGKKVAPNAACPCGSGRKAKKCCFAGGAKG
mmetsp:Transcript_44605/g.115421  ORF Transcript_44605/g.115421 Transcript_44605/m.115421 type:complete len:143 (+) Transcript_44605:73-501(+)